MYKPPQNSNRVKSIKSKFENIENRKDSSPKEVKNGIKSDQFKSPVKKPEPLLETSLTSNHNRQTLSRQLSDPLKRNIKRTPAFRVDKNSEKACGLQRNSCNRSTLFESKVKQFNSVKSSDKVEKDVENRCGVSSDSEFSGKSEFLSDNKELKSKGNGLGSEFNDKSNVSIRNFGLKSDFKCSAENHDSKIKCSRLDGRNIGVGEKSESLAKKNCLDQCFTSNCSKKKYFPSNKTDMNCSTSTNPGFKSNLNQNNEFLASFKYSPTKNTVKTDSYWSKPGFPSGPKGFTTSCDKKTDLLLKTFFYNPSFKNVTQRNTPECSKPNISPKTKPILLKSKSSQDFQLIRRKFDKSPTREALPPIQNPNDNENTPHHDNINSNQSNTNLNEETSVLKNIDLSLLYTEPIPKSLRTKNTNSESSDKAESPVLTSKLDSIYNKSTLKLTDNDKKDFLETLKQALQNQDLPAGLTDTLKSALNKPLPGGPAPKKPPRTFQHCAEADLENNLQKNSSFLHVEKPNRFEKKLSPKKGGKRGDAKYMLNKLENALKNNKLRARKQQKVEVSTTSGEDSDDSLLFRSKSCRALPKILVNHGNTLPNGSSMSPSLNSKAPTSNYSPSSNLYTPISTSNAPISNFSPTSSVEPISMYAPIPMSNTNVPSSHPISNNFSDFSLGDLNCLKSFGCKNPAYERIKEPNSLFFVENKGVEPVYAEPIQCRRQKGEERESSTKENRNSLYYMSTALLNRNEMVNGSSDNHQDTNPKMEDLRLDCVNRQISAENSSLSSFTSDLDSNPSPVADDPHAKIRCLIENFETQRRQTLPKTQKLERQERVYDCSDYTNRVEVLKNSLEMTLDRSFSSSANVTITDSRDTDWDKNVTRNTVTDIIAKFQTYQKSAPKYCQPKINKDTLFYCCLVIEKVQDCAQIKFKFPPNVEIPSDIEHLCFPESPDAPPLDGTSAAQTYSLLVTNEMGERTFGYCRRVLPEGSWHCLPLAYCILSKYRAPRFYKKVLIELESRHGMQNKYRDDLISQFYYKKFPKPGESISINLSCIEPKKVSKRFEDSLDLTSYVHVNKSGEYGALNTSKKPTSIFISENDIRNSCSTPSYVAYEGNKTELVLTLHPDTRYEDTDLKRLHKLPTDILLKIFSSLLLERKVILISSVISDLSSCVDSLQSILYPFTWYHTFIPILPESLWDIVESPTPVVCGVLSVDAVEDRRIENGIVVNLDARTVLAEEGDEMKILSGSMQKIWRRSIALANKAATSLEYIHSVYLADAYLQVFICCLKNYKEFVTDGGFLKEEFMKNAKTKGIRRFLKMFTETCMFHAFMDAALNNPASLEAFNKKIEMYGSDESSIILDKLLEWNR